MSETFKNPMLCLKPAGLLLLSEKYMFNRTSIRNKLMYVSVEPKRFMIQFWIEQNRLWHNNKAAKWLYIERNNHIWMKPSLAAPHCLNIKQCPYWLVVNFIRMSITIIAYLVLIILWAVKSIRHNPISLGRSEVHTVWGFTVHGRPS